MRGLRGLFGVPFAAAALLGNASYVTAQPEIVHAELECVAPGRFVVVLSGMTPEEQIQTAKVYFRSSLFPDFYYVEMTREGERFVGILPQPLPETKRILYYLEAVDLGFNSTRSREFDPPVEDCDDDPAAAYFAGAQPGIIVGATTAGASVLPPGFSAVGIGGTITAAGVASGVGSGIGGGAAVAVGAGVAGAAGTVVVLTADNPETTTSTGTGNAPQPPPATSTVSSSPAPPPPGTTTTAPQSPTPTPTTSTSTSTVPNTTSTVPGGPSTTTTTTITTSTTTSVVTTSSTSTTSTTAPALNACFTVQVTGDCRVRLDATCSPTPIDRYEWILDVNDRWQRVDILDGSATFTHTFSSCGESNATIQFRLIVHRSGASASSDKSIVVTGNDDLRAPPVLPALRVATSLTLPGMDGSGRGRLLVNGQFVRAIVAGTPDTVEVGAPAGENRIEGIVLSASGGDGWWRFDMSSDLTVVAGSLRVTQGQVLSVEPRAVTLRLSGDPQERIEVRFERSP